MNFCPTLRPLQRHIFIQLKQTLIAFNQLLLHSSRLLTNATSTTFTSFLNRSFLVSPTSIERMSWSCLACESLKQKCNEDCVLAPYFPLDQAEKFEKVNKVYGAANVAKILSALVPTQRENAVKSLVFEAEVRFRDPIYGSVGVISHFQDKRRQIKQDVLKAEDELCMLLGLSPKY